MLKSKSLLKSFKYLKNESGATSVLVVFMMIVLVTFGMFTIVAASANMRLSQKAVAWNNNYYELESSANVQLGLIDEILLQAEMKTDMYFSGNSEVELPGDLKNYVEELLLQKSAESLSDALKAVYLYCAKEELANLAVEYNNIVTFPLANGNIIEDLIIDYNLISNTNEKFLFFTSLGVKFNRESFDIYNESYVSTDENSEKRYEILEWTESQIVPDADETIDLWPGL